MRETTNNKYLPPLTNVRLFLAQSSSSDFSQIGGKNPDLSRVTYSRAEKILHVFPAKGQFWHFWGFKNKTICCDILDSVGGGGEM